MDRIDFLFKNLQPGKILDIGNLGSQAKIHKKLISEFGASQIYGLDIEDQGKYGLSFTNQFIGNAEQLPFADDFFDTVYLGEVIEHTWQPKKLLDECRRVLAPNGKLIMDTPNAYSFAQIFRYLLNGKDIMLMDRDHKIIYSRAMLENICLQSGFGSINITSDRKFTIKGKNITLPNFATFKILGAHLLLTAEK